MRRVLDAATSTPAAAVVLEDLHWADEATLRTLAHLLATAPADARLCVVGTRRAQPEPTGALALVGESFARRHAARVDVTGLDREGTAALLEPGWPSDCRCRWSTPGTPARAGTRSSSSSWPGSVRATPTTCRPRSATW